MENMTPSTFPLYTPNPLFYGLPDHLKDPANYDKIQRALLETLACPTSHSDPLKMAECQKCTENMLNRRLLIKRLGFSGSAQFMAWKKVMEHMIHPERLKRVVLDKYRKDEQSGTNRPA